MPIVALRPVGRAARPGAGDAALRLLAGAAAPLLLLAAYQQAVFGRPWVTGYAYLDPASVYAAGQGRGFLGVGWPRPDVALALLAGLRRGLLVHAPWLAAGPPRGGAPLAPVAGGGR